MCGRFFVEAKNPEISEFLADLPPDSALPKTGVVYPTENALILTQIAGNLVPRVMAWSFPRRDGLGVIFNARAETALQKPMFAGALRRHPATIPVNAFYEWRDDGQKKKKFVFTAKKFTLLYLAGFWNFFGKDYTDAPEHFTILTTRANASVAPYHPRMPVLLAENEISLWLRGYKPENILFRTPFEVVAADA